MTYYINGHVVAPGVVIEGTLTTEELLRAFCDEHHKYRSVVPDYVMLAECWLEDDRESLWAVYDEDCTAWEAIGQELVDITRENLDAIAPTGLRFGNTEGDGACWGWWETDEEDQL